MKYAIFIIALLICTVGAIGLSQSTGQQKQMMIATPEGPNIGLSANAIERNETAWDVVQLRGDVQIRTKDMVLRADEAAYNGKTGEIEARGTVHVKLASQR